MQDPASPQGELVAEFEVEPEEFAAALKLMSSKRFYRTEKRSYLTKALGIALAFVIGIGLVWLPDALSQSGIIGAVDVWSIAIGVVMSAVVLAAIALNAIRSMNRRLVTSVEQYVIDDRVVLKCDRKGLVFVTKSKSITLNYTGIDEIVAVAKGMLVCSGLLGHYIPNSAFASDEKRRGFFQFLRQRLDASVVEKSEMLKAKGKSS